jgi:exodeoxyribonuclease III
MVVIFSWNVAGWNTTKKNIIDHDGSIEKYFFDRHGADVVCLQEMKMKREDLATQPAEHGFGPESKVDAFFACNGGYSGVATLVRPGITSSADANCLGKFGDSTHQDHEGRCVLTRHGDITVINVYVPTTPNTARLGFKMRFLEALRRKVDAERQAGQRVVLAGDLNIARRGIDCHPSSRRIDVALLAQHPCTSATEDAIRSALADVSVVVHGAGFRISAGGVLVGRTFNKRSDAENEAKQYQLEEVAVDEEARHYVSSPANQITLARLKEVLRASAMPELTLPDVDNLAAKAVSPSAACAVAWLEKLVGTDGVLLDLWAEEQPLARCRATC